MASPLEMLQLGQSFDPYGSFRKGGMEGQQYDVEQQKLDIQQAGLAQQQKEIAAEQKQPMGLDKQAMLAVPKNWNLNTPDGLPSVAGEINTKMVDAKNNQLQGQKIMNQAKYATDYKEKKDLFDTGRRLFDEGTRLQKEARDDTKKTVSGLFMGLGTAQTPQEWDTALKTYQDSGIPLPEGFPIEYSSDNQKKVIAIAKAKDPQIASKIEADNRASEREREESSLRKMKLRKGIASEQNGATPSKTYDTLEEKVADPNYGVAKGKIPAKEQTIARRINLDAKEVVTGVDQVMTLTNGGMRDTTGTTFANVKDSGLLTAPAKFFTNKISDKDSQMYDAMMYPLVKGIALYSNPDYRPTEADVKNAMISYKAQSGQPQSVQLEKMAELKKNFLAASESFLDSNILNPQQANSLKQQIRAMEKAIPWNVNDVVGFTRQKDYKNFKEYLAAKGELPEDKADSKKSETKPTPTAEDIALAKTSPELAAKFEAHFGVKP